MEIINRIINGMINFSRPEWLWLLPLCLLPLWRWQRQTHAYPGLALLPPDTLSRNLDWLIRICSAALFALLISAMAEPYKGQQTIEKTGTGAHVVVLLDRSSSMNDHFTRKAKTFKGPKNEVARAVLNKLIDQSNNDFYGLVSFSTSALYMLPLSQNLEVIRAGINSTLNRGRGSTAIGTGLAEALSYFTDTPKTGSRVILLVSDGGGIIPTAEQARLRQQFRDSNVAIYWIYLKSTHGNTLSTGSETTENTGNAEDFLHKFFGSLSVPYHPYEIEEEGALEAAITDIGELKNQPLAYQEILPRVDLANYCYGLALLFFILLLPARWMEADQW